MLQVSDQRVGEFPGNCPRGKCPGEISWAGEWPRPVIESSFFLSCRVGYTGELFLKYHFTSFYHLMISFYAG